MKSLRFLVKIAVNIAVCLLVIAPLKSNACLYNTAINELILEDTVPVCFVNIPEQATTAEQKTILDAIDNIKRSLQDLDAATTLNFSGFGACKPRSGKPEIRISLDNTNPGGHANTKPGYSKEEVNINLSYLATRGSKSDTKGQQTALYPMPPGTYRWLAKHEVLHLFGLDHDHRIAGQSMEKLRSIKPTIKAMPDPNNPSQARAIDPNSIMNLNDQDMNAFAGQASPKIPLGKLLGDLDVQCINSVVSEARSQRTTPSQAGSSQPTPRTSEAGSPQPAPKTSGTAQ